MKASTALKPAMLFAAGSFASAAQAAPVIEHVDYHPAFLGGTDITIGGASSPQYNFAKDDTTSFVLSGNNGALVGAGSQSPYFPAADNPTLSSSVKTGNGINNVFGGASSQDQYYGLRFQIGSDDYTGFARLNGAGDTINELGYKLASDVPEPATWALMIAGFGGLGLAMRRRRAQSFAAAVA